VIFRIPLTYVSLFAVATGPVLCCCAVGRLVASSNPADPVTGDSTTTHSCCGHRPARTVAPAANTPKFGSEDSAGTRGSCACASGRTEVSIASTSSRVEEVTGAVWAVAFDLISPAANLGRPAVASTAHPGRGGAARFPSASALLYSHHKLRC
jgi:hypothetical protein